MSLPSTHPLILNQFSPLQRKQLVTWFLEDQKQDQQGRCHLAFLKALAQASRLQVCQHLLDLKTKIAYTVLNEFGLSFGERPAYNALINLVSSRMRQSNRPQ